MNEDQRKGDPMKKKDKKPLKAIEGAKPEPQKDDLEPLDPEEGSINEADQDQEEDG
jgi:hypothetical protein